MSERQPIPNQPIHDGQAVARTSPAAARAGKTPPPISVEGLRKSFGAVQALKGIDLQVFQGETLAVLGRSGTGKSVLLRLIVGLLPPDAGAICVRGEKVTGAPLETLNHIRKTIGFLFQSGALYDSLTVEENVAFPLRRHAGLSDQETKKRVRELLARVGMEKDVAKLPAQISGGMQKRVGLARALALDPNILLFDEPTAGLDPITAAEIGALIVKLQKERGTSAIVVTHDVTLTRIVADRLAMLRDGNILVQGTFDQLEKSRDPFVRQFLSSAGEEIAREVSHV